MTGRIRGAWRTLLAAVALLVIGAVAGITADRLVQAHERAGRTALLKEMHADPIAVFERTLQLRPDQRERVAAIYSAHQAALDSTWHRAHIELRGTLNRVSAEIRTVLDPEQVRRFHSLVEELHGSDGALPLH